MRLKNLVLASLLLTSSGCFTVTATRKGTTPKATEPDYQTTEHFFLWGLAPDARVVNVKKACSEKAPSQLQTQTTFVDGFLSLITLGIYAPRTARVWCS